MFEKIPVNKNEENSENNQEGFVTVEKVKDALKRALKTDNYSEEGQSRYWAVRIREDLSKEDQELLDYVREGELIDLERTNALFYNSKQGKNLIEEVDENIKYRVHNNLDACDPKAQIVRDIYSAKYYLKNWLDGLKSGDVEFNKIQKIIEPMIEKDKKELIELKTTNPDIYQEMEEMYNKEVESTWRVFAKLYPYAEHSGDKEILPS